MKVYAIGIAVTWGLFALNGCGGSDTKSNAGGGGKASTSGGTTSKAGAGSGGTSSTSHAGAASSVGGRATSGGAPSSGGTGLEGLGGACDAMGQMAGMMMPDMPTNCPAYDACIMKAGCDATLTECFGENGDGAGGACGASVSCINACNCDPTCSQACLAGSQECTACFQTSFTCLSGCLTEAFACAM
jgi:hypothetical protein